MAVKHNKLSIKLRLLTKKLKMLLRVKDSSVGHSQAVNTKMEHCEMDENLANEALEAKIRQLIIDEYGSRVASLNRPVSLRIEGHLTIIPTTPASSVCNFDWERNAVGSFCTADSDICWRDCSDVASSTCSSQKPEKQVAV